MTAWEEAFSPSTLEIHLGDIRPRADMPLYVGFRDYTCKQWGVTSCHDSPTGAAVRIKTILNGPVPADAEFKKIRAVDIAEKRQINVSRSAGKGLVALHFCPNVQM
ncbi:hypothetical protein GCM10010329_17680 [Streptomyces spiroverticillatus]|uniref:Uncharacterized protein n=1 Tax=Streptomyces finlayi TaxID=67296 RepID=A0A918WTS7_9ACTN|nr:hypothetical protein [Streptomyces finlayi]GGZ96910.1 hypothetical protein GCM10010329_17680 [Streptomyces spiroverticillatus]GHC82163.1 hypothetical protein GCM10010334_10160 [Streptomyces finlayi]